MNSLIGIKKTNWYTKVYNTYMCPSRQQKYAYAYVCSVQFKAKFPLTNVFVFPDMKNKSTCSRRRLSCRVCKFYGRADMYSTLCNCLCLLGPICNIWHKF